MSFLQRHLETLVRDRLGNMPAVELPGSVTIELMRQASFSRTADCAEIDLLLDRSGHLRRAHAVRMTLSRI